MKKKSATIYSYINHQAKFIENRPILEKKKQTNKQLALVWLVC